MDFFEFTGIAGMFIPSSLHPFTALWVALLIGGILFAVVYGFQAAALWVISGREGYKHRWMSFVPFLNTYYIGVLSEKNRIYNIPAKRFSLVLAILEAVCVGLFIFDYVCSGIVFAGDLYVEVTQTDMITGLEYASGYAASTAIQGTWLAWVFDYFSGYVLNWINLAYILFNVLVVISFFQTYACRYFVVYSLFSVFFPIKGILFFVVRKNRSTNYRNYVRNQQQARYEMYQQYNRQNGGNPYGYNPYTGQPNRPGSPYDTRPSGSASDPFEEFANSTSPRPDDKDGGSDEHAKKDGDNPPEDPFSEFDK